MSDPLLLPGSIPGLLRRGAPVLWASRRGVVVDATFGDDADSYVVICVEATPLDDASCEWEPRRDLSLDLRDPAGRDVALRYVAEKTKSPSSIGHSWARAFDSLRHWSIAGGVRGNGHSWSLTFHPGPGGVPALASIPLDDPNADALALAAVVRHLAGVDRG